MSFDMMAFLRMRGYGALAAAKSVVPTAMLSRAPNLTRIVNALR